MGPRGFWHSPQGRAVIIVCSLVVVFFAGFMVVTRVAGATVYTPPTSPFTEPTWIENKFNCEEQALGTNAKAAETSEHILWQIAKNNLRVCLGLQFYSTGWAARMFWITEEALRIREGVESGNTKLGELKTLLGEINTKLAATLKAEVTNATAEKPLHVTGGEGGGGSSAEVIAAIEESAEAELHALYYIAGALAAGILAYAIYRQGVLKP